MVLHDFQYQEIQYHISEVKHYYGSNVHILSDPFLFSHLAMLCSESTHQPVINELISTLYSSLLKTVVNQEFPRVKKTIHSRMSPEYSEGIFESTMIDSEVSVVSVNLARAGTLPSHICYDALNYFMNPKKIRQDHIGIERVFNEEDKVTGSCVSGYKIGGQVENSIVLFPDPMGATGSTLVKALDLYKTKGNALKYIALHCIITPEYLKKVSTFHPDLKVYAVRLDRGLSSEEVLRSVPGTYWENEKGLNHKHYIVPGGGGFGEIINNAFI